MKLFKHSMVIALAACILGCEAETSNNLDNVGTMELALSSTLGDTVYVLQNANFVVQGNGVYLTLNGNDVELIQEDLAPGDYTVTLQDYWRIDRINPDGTTDQEVPSRLISDNPVPFTITENTVMPIVYVFEAGDGVIPFGNGRLQLGVDIVENNGDTPLGCAGAIDFPDSALEARIRSAIGKPTGDIVFADVIGLTDFYAVQQGIADLTGMQCLTGLETLSLARNPGITDLSPLAGLTNLTELVLGEDTGIADISPLASLTNLETLNLVACSISDISALSSLPNLSYVVLELNQISDLQPLVDNASFAEGDYLSIVGNPIDCRSSTIIIQLSSLNYRGVDLNDDCL